MKSSRTARGSDRPNKISRDKLKKFGGGGPVAQYPEGGSIGVPLEMCPVCPLCHSTSPTCTTCVEYLPYLVKLCCDIVSEKGLDSRRSRDLSYFRQQ